MELWALEKEVSGSLKETEIDKRKSRPTGGNTLHHARRFRLKPIHLLLFFKKNKNVQQNLLLFFKKNKMCNKICCSFSKYFKCATKNHRKNGGCLVLKWVYINKCKNGQENYRKTGQTRGYVPFSVRSGVFVTRHLHYRRGVLH